MSNNTVPTPANPAGWKFETRQIHAGQAPDAATFASPVRQRSPTTKGRRIRAFSHDRD